MCTVLLLLGVNPIAQQQQRYIVWGIKVHWRSDRGSCFIEVSNHFAAVYNICIRHYLVIRSHAFLTHCCRSTIHTEYEICYRIVKIILQILTCVWLFLVTQMVLILFVTWLLWSWDCFLDSFCCLLYWTDHNIAACCDSIITWRDGEVPTGTLQLSSSDSS
jgi:hypothetical protein